MHDHDSIRIVASLIGYLYFSLALYSCARKTNSDGAILAFIPILFLAPLLNASKRSWLWILGLIFIFPIAWAWIWMGIAEARGKSALLGILMLVPLVNLFVLGYIAFAD